MNTNREPYKQIEQEARPRNNPTQLQQKENTTLSQLVICLVLLERTLLLSFNRLSRIEGGWFQRQLVGRTACSVILARRWATLFPSFATQVKPQPLRFWGKDRISAKMFIISPFVVSNLQVRMRSRQSFSKSTMDRPKLTATAAASRKAKASAMMGLITGKCLVIPKTTSSL